MMASGAACPCSSERAADQASFISGAYSLAIGYPNSNGCSTTMATATATTAYVMRRYHGGPLAATSHAPRAADPIAPAAANPIGGANNTMNRTPWNVV